MSVRFPEVTVGPGANLAKRVLQIAGVSSDTDELYGAIEVGGIIVPWMAANTGSSSVTGSTSTTIRWTCTGCWPAPSGPAVCLE